MRILLVDDDDRLRPRLARAFSERGHEVVEAEDVASAKEALAEHSPEWAVVDLKMPGPDGLELVAALHERVPGCRTVVLTGYGSIATAVEAMRLGAHDYLSKPATADQILAALSKEPGDSAPAFETPSLARAEWEHIHRVLEECEGNISEAARRLGLHRRTLQRKLSKYPPRE